MAAPDPLVEMSDFSLAPRAPSIQGTKGRAGERVRYPLLGAKQQN